MKLKRILSLFSFILIYGLGYEAFAYNEKSLLICKGEPLIYLDEKILAHDLNQDLKNDTQQRVYIGYIQREKAIAAFFERDDGSTLSFLIPESFREPQQKDFVTLSTGQTILCESTDLTARLWMILAYVY